MKDFEYIGGHIWSLYEPDPKYNGEYDRTVLSLEIENGKGWIFEKLRPLTNEETQKLNELLLKEKAILDD